MLDYAQEKREKKKDALKIVWILGLLSIIFIVIVARFALANDNDVYTGLPGDDAVYAMAKTFVRPTFKATSVNFLASGYNLVRERDSVYIIRSFAETKDNTGWKEKTNFEIVLKYKGGPSSIMSNWEVLNLTKD